MKSALVKVFGFPATLVHGDPLVLDRWMWLRAHLPKVPGASKRLLDVGCGTGAFTIGAALRGYDALGLSWDERNQNVARERASMCQAPLARFATSDVRDLDRHEELNRAFDFVVCCENIEHILNDEKLMVDMARCLKPGGTLLLTTPNYYYKPMGGDEGPFPPVEDGGHVRRGYKPEDLMRLCALAALCNCKIGYCSGVASQKITVLMRRISAISPLLGWAAVLPLRWLPLLFDNWLTPIVKWPRYSITMIATK